MANRGMDIMPNLKSQKKTLIGWTRKNWTEDFKFKNSWWFGPRIVIPWLAKYGGYGHFKRVEITIREVRDE